MVYFIQPPQLSKENSKENRKDIKQKDSLDFDYDNIDDNLDDSKKILKEKSSIFVKNRHSTPDSIDHNRIKYKNENSSKGEAKASRASDSFNYNRIVKMMGGNSTMTEKFESQGSNPLSNLLKAYEKQKKKETEDNVNLVNQLRNKLNDFEKNMEKRQIHDLMEDSQEIAKQKQEKHQIIHMLPREQTTNDKLLKERIFWSKEKMYRIREKFFNAKKRIDNKTEDDFNHIRRWIEEGEEENVISTLLNEHFKAFYKLEIKKQGILEHMLLNNRPQLLKIVLKDDFYMFNYNFIFDQIEKIMKEKEKGLHIDEEEVGTLFKNVIENDLYNPSLVTLLAWFIGSFHFFDSFRNLVAKHSEFNKVKEYYNKFESDYDINCYIENGSNYKDTMIACLENNLQHLAM